MRLLMRGTVQHEAILMQGRESRLLGVERAFQEVLRDGKNFPHGSDKLSLAKLD